MTLAFELLTPREVLAKEASVDEIIIPAHWGQMDILPQHTDFVTTLTQGELTYRVGTKKETHNILGGLLTIKGDQATVLVDGVLAKVTPIKPARG
ncbi:MAG: hypothetical protein HQM16_10990 [Deltaproteobacteria bacterium]|nr:hypothetical protein [Deltaproteobacteria bacterium]